MKLTGEEQLILENLISRKYDELTGQLHGGVNPTAFRLGFISASNHYRASVIERDELRKQLDEQLKAYFELLVKSNNQTNHLQTIAQNISATLEEVKRLKGILTGLGIITK